MKAIWFIPIVVMISVMPAESKGRAPEHKKAADDKPATTLKQDTNRALNGVDKGVHEGLGVVKEGAQEAMDAVDRGVHKIIKENK